ncbi:hypothetical protein SDC9_73334 [bioreactor metagenome]|uniref:Uncharacterized protein n=1 Tax=bioreactor metagenome TaxID=1076179 RepID=A0A644YES5_9ZZZZ
MDGFAEVLRVTRINKGDVDAKAGEGVGKLIVGTAIQGRSRDDVIAGAGQGENGLSLGGMPGGNG